MKRQLKIHIEVHAPHGEGKTTFLNDFKRWLKDRFPEVNCIDQEIHDMEACYFVVQWEGDPNPK